MIDLEGELISKPADRDEALKNSKEIKWKKTFFDKLSLYIKERLDGMELYG